MRSRRSWCSQAIVHSTTQRFFPSPEPCGLFGQAIFASMPRRRSSRRPSREWYDNVKGLVYIDAFAPDEGETAGEPDAATTVLNGEQRVVTAQEDTVDGEEGAGNDDPRPTCLRGRGAMIGLAEHTVRLFLS
jgi:hypothetical protein